MKRTLRYGMVGGGQNAFIGEDHPGTVNWVPLTRLPGPLFLGEAIGKTGQCPSAPSRQDFLSRIYRRD